MRSDEIHNADLRSADLRRADLSDAEMQFTKLGADCGARIWPAPPEPTASRQAHRCLHPIAVAPTGSIDLSAPGKLMVRPQMCR